MPLALTAERDGQHVISYRDAAGRQCNVIARHPSRESALAAMRELNVAARESARRHLAEGSPAPVAAPARAAVAAPVVAAAPRVSESAEQVAERGAADALAESFRLIRQGGVLDRETRNDLWRQQENIPGTNAWRLREMAEGRSGRVAG